MNGENLHGKNPHWVILKLPLPRIHYYHNKRLQVKKSQYLIPTYSWTLTPILNWTCFIMKISHFQCTAPNTWLTNCANPSRRLQSPTRKGCWLQNSLVHHTMKIKKFLNYKNPTVYKHNSFFKRKINKGQFCLWSQFAWTKLFFTLVQPLMALKNNPYIYLRLWEKKAQTYTYGFDEKQPWKIEFHKPQ